MATEYVKLEFREKGNLSVYILMSPKNKWSLMPIGLIWFPQKETANSQEKSIEDKIWGLLHLEMKKYIYIYMCVWGVASLSPSLLLSHKLP